MAVAVTSASGVLALLDEDDDLLKIHALTSLNQLVDRFWYQISSSVAILEALFEDEDFPKRELAAVVASKVFYHLGELDDALHYALRAGSFFDLADKSEFSSTMVARCLDKYFEQRQQQFKGEEVEIDERLTSIVERMIERCCQEGQFEQAIGVSLEAMRLDKVKEVLAASSNKVDTLKYALTVSQENLGREFRHEVLRLVVKQFEETASPEWTTICQCLMFLDDPQEVASILYRLLTGSQEEVLLAYQVGFNLVENEMKSFMMKVRQRLEELCNVTPEAATPEQGEGGAAAEAGASATASGGAAAATVSRLTGEHKERYEKLTSIITGLMPIRLYLEFLFFHNKADLQVLNNVKNAFDARISVCHTATVLANALMHCGTTVDTFLRSNLDWLAKATNWAKFGATASLGVIHRGHLSSSRSLMAPHLPREGTQVSPYSEGGALMALGLIHINHGEDIQSFVLDSLRNTREEVVQHGACLGLGLAALGTDNDDVFDDLKGVLYTDHAIAGEAAGLGMGLLAAGTASRKSEEMLTYAHDTQHEKIIRGLAMGLALVMYGQEENAEALIEQMTGDQDPILRYGGMFCIGMAYRGTDNNGAIQKLLHFAVTDVSSDVRRAAVMCLGFVLIGVPQQCPRIVSLLAESYNPHLRYGAAMAVGIACAGTGMRDATALLEPMLTDAVDFVRQGANIAMALVMIQQPERQLSRLRQHLAKVIGDKHEEVMAKMGAIMATGIIDAGGRNVTVGLRSRSGYFRRTAVIGLAMFTQYWFWFPLAYFLSLAFSPTALVALDGTLRRPKLEFSCSCPRSLFAYAEPATQQAIQQVSKVPTAILSTTAKARERARKKAEEKASRERAGGAPSGAAAGTNGNGAEMDADGGGEGGAAGAKEDGGAGGEGEGMEVDAAKPDADEASPYTMANPARVVPAQQKFVSFKAGSRFVPVVESPVSMTGIILVKDTAPVQTVDYVSSDTADAAVPATTPAPDNDDEPEPPPPTYYTPSSTY